MQQKFNDLSLKTYIAYKGFVHGFKNFMHNFKEDERGLSGVVVAVLLILVAVLAVVLIWGLLSGWIQKMWDIFMDEADKGLKSNG